MPQQLKVIFKCPDCGVERVKEKRGSYTKTFDRYTDRKLFYKKRDCTHPKVVCQRCGRPLTAHRSVKNGVGPVCEKILQEVSA